MTLNNSKKHILLVDDNITNNQILTKMLQHEYEIGSTENGYDALEYARQKQPDLILLDIVMPEIDGFKVCEKLKSDKTTRDILILFISGRQDIASKTKAFELGGIDYIAKPFNSAEVKARIKTHLELLDYRKNLEDMVNIRTMQLQEANNKLILSQIQLIHRLGVAGEYKDNETGQHVVRVSLFSGIIAENMGLDRETVNIIRMCSSLHDIGKIGIPDKILLKPGPLNDEEWEIMKSHSGIGKDILLPAVNEKISSGNDTEFDSHRVSKLIDIASNIAGCHHEKWNGTGYPVGLKGDEIPIEARIVCLADVFDALSTKRPYKEPYSDDNCFSIIREMTEITFDPIVVDAFFQSLNLILQVKRDLQD